MIAGYTGHHYGNGDSGGDIAESGNTTGWRGSGEAGDAHHGVAAEEGAVAYLLYGTVEIDVAQACALRKGFTANLHDRGGELQVGERCATAESVGWDGGDG